MKSSSPTLPKLSEDTIQEMVVSGFSALSRPHKFMFFMVPNGAAVKAKGGNVHARIAKLQRMGMILGASDLVIVCDGRAYFLELKTTDGEQSENQKRFEDWAIECGAPYRLAHSYEEAMAVMADWGIIPA